MQLIFSTPNKLAIASIRERSLRQSGCFFPSSLHIARYSPNSSGNTFMEAIGSGIGFSYIASSIGRGLVRRIARKAQHLPIEEQVARRFDCRPQRCLRSSRPINVRSLQPRFAVLATLHPFSFLINCCDGGIVARRTLRKVNAVFLRPADFGNLRGQLGGRKQG